VTGGWIRMPRFTAQCSFPATYNPHAAGGSHGYLRDLMHFLTDTKERLRNDSPVRKSLWAVKGNARPRSGREETIFLRCPSDIWSDNAGIHVTLHQHDGTLGWATEAICSERNSGYGHLWYPTNSRTDNLDVNVTFGGASLMTITADGKGSQMAQTTARLISAKTRAGGVSTDRIPRTSSRPYNYVALTRHRSQSAGFSSAPALTRILIWKARISAAFHHAQGHYCRRLTIRRGRWWTNMSIRTIRRRVLCAPCWARAHPFQFMAE